MARRRGDQLGLPDGTEMRDELAALDTGLPKLAWAADVMCSSAVLALRVEDSMGR